MASTPLLNVSHLYRSFDSGGEPVDILKDINLLIEAGEMVAIIGASGSGKTTLMNILGCLDRPSRGEYRVGGQNTGLMEPDELARLRREYFGFIFQRYQLLGDLSAEDNVSIPAIYAGVGAAERHERSQKLLQRLGLGDRTAHKPSQLSGGQQQRVSIARALVNGGEVILADEPTGALDSVSGAEVIRILQELNAEGHTVIIVTHDMNIACHARRIIEIKDGVIIADHANAPSDTPAAAIAPTTPTTPTRPRSTAAISASNLMDRFREAAKMAVRAILAHRMRSFLTMLGIIIGISSVVSVVALGKGSQQQILSSISGLGTNTIDIYPGELGDRRSAAVRTLTIANANILAQQSFVEGVTPSVSRGVTLRRDNITATAQMRGVGDQYFQVRGLTMAKGRSFDQTAIDNLTQDAVIDQSTLKTLFPEGGNVIGQTILINNMPARVVAVAAENNTAFNSGNNLTVWIPYTTAMSRLLGQSYISSITVRIKSTADSNAAESTITKILTLRHGTQDFSLLNSDSIRQTIKDATGTMTLLVSMIALISLIVGGIGVMNIMLVSVTERTQEIGVRMAVGARQSDIMQQFLIESVLLCLLGGLIGILLSLAFGFVFDHISTQFSLIYSAWSIIAAFLCATIIGIAFGFLPARNAAKLDPVVALSRE